MKVLNPGDVVTAVEGQPVSRDQYYILAQHLEKAAGQPIKISVKNSEGKDRTVEIKPHFAARFGDEPINFAGMQMINRIDYVQSDSPLFGKVKPGDLVVNLADPSASGGQWSYPTFETLVTETNAAGSKNLPLTITVRRDGKDLTFTTVPSIKVTDKRWGFGVAYHMADDQPVIASTIVKDSPADLAKIRGGSTIVSINDQKVSNWFDMKNILSRVKPNEPVKVAASFENNVTTYTLPVGLTQTQIAEINSNCLTTYAYNSLDPDEFIRIAPSMAVAGKWGAEETRDAILQVYQTIRSMSSGGVSVREVSGPVGILTAGYLVAARGFVHLVWFLSIISANLAVMNFLPIPIVDGGLFTFLVIEKIKGSPLSQRTQAIAQVVGLALLLSVFVFATFQDVSRLPMLFGKN
jgi:regulator of sigma E protease